MTPQQYVAILRANYVVNALRYQLAVAEQNYAALLTAAGLDPTKPLRYDDATLEIVPVTDSATQQ